MKIKSQKDFFSGLIFMAAGIAFAWGATGYTVGHGDRMGPGYFPLILGVLLTVIGLFVTFQALVVETEDGEKVGNAAWKPLLFVIGANVVFGILLAGLPKFGIPALGLVVAIFALVFIAALAGDEFKLREVAILALVLAVGSYLAFIVRLQLQFPVWPSFISG